MWACTVCHGKGEVELRPTCYHNSPCPCPTGLVQCDECRGSGKAQCADCGTADAEYQPNGELVCRDCCRKFHCAEGRHPGAEMTFYAPHGDFDLYHCALCGARVEVPREAA